jgi:hypothetical protein
MEIAKAVPQLYFKEIKLERLAGLGIIKIRMENIYDKVSKYTKIKP